MLKNKKFSRLIRLKRVAILPLKPLSDRTQIRPRHRNSCSCIFVRARAIYAYTCRVLPLAYAKGRRRGEPQGNRRDEGVIVNVTHAEVAARHMGRYSRYASVTSMLRAQAVRNSHA